MVDGQDKMDALKIASAWAAVGVTSWSDFAALVASLYTCVLIGEWFWKKALRPYCEKHGWVKKQLRRKSDREYS
jgi:flavodoxin